MYHKKGCRCNFCFKQKGKNSPHWKGEKTSYLVRHRWIERMLGKPSICEHCKINSLPPNFYHWANVSGKYLREGKNWKKDWKRLCVKCHRIFDRKSYQGERNAMAKLNKKDIPKIRKLYKTGKYIQEEIAKIFRVSRRTIGRIINKQLWGHIK